MAILYDVHMHSSFSTDSDSPMQTMAEAAIRRGLDGVCFTDHMDLDYPGMYFPSDPDAFAADPEKILKEVLRLRQVLCGKDGSFRIGFGLEFGMQPHLAGRFHDIAAEYPLDFIIASQHLVGSFDPYYPASWDTVSPKKQIDRYYQEMFANLKKMEDWDTLGHLDYIIRYIPDRNGLVYDSMENHREIIDQILSYVISQGKCLEVNTAGYKYGLNQPHPAPSILKRYLELGGSRITIGADAHEPDQIAFAYDKTAALLRSLGFDHYEVFERRRALEFPL